MQAWFKRITENKPAPTPNLGLSPRLHYLLIRAVDASTFDQKRDIYWETVARLGNDVGGTFRVFSWLRDSVREHSLSVALAKKGFRSIVCDDDNKCSRGTIVECDCLDKFDYSSMIPEKINHRDRHVLYIAREIVNNEPVAVYDAHNACYINAAMVAGTRARERGKKIMAYDNGMMRFDQAGLIGHGLEEFKQKLENYCRERNYDII